MQKITDLEKAQLLADITGSEISKARLYRREIENSLSLIDKGLYESYLLRMQKGESVARIIGKRWFWQDEFLIQNTLEPRGDSETIIEAVQKNFKNKEADLKFLDIGTGSGCLLLSLLREYKNAKGVGIDNSILALGTARTNGKNLNLEERCNFIECDYRLGLPTEDYDIIISNPPYIKSSDIAELEDRVKTYDPYQSLDGGEDGLDAYRVILQQAKSDYIFFEIGQHQEKDIEEIGISNGYKLLSSYHDLSDIIRVLFFKKV